MSYIDFRWPLSIVVIGASYREHPSQIRIRAESRL